MSRRRSKALARLEEHRDALEAAYLAGGEESCARLAESLLLANSPRWAVRVAVAQIRERCSLRRYLSIGE